MPRGYRNTASFGKREEYNVISELLNRGFDVYMTLVDDQGIDCIIRYKNGKYVDVQIKARSSDVKQWNLFAAMTFRPRENYWFIFYTEKNGSYWVIPSKKLARLCSRNKTGKNIGKRHVSLPRKNDGKVAERFASYKNDAGFELLKREGRR